MKFRSRAAVLGLMAALVMGFTSGWGGSAGATTVTADPNDRRQTVDGFGTALGWFTDNPFGSPRSLYNTPAFEDLYFDDLGVSIGRMELQYTVFSDTQSVNPSNAEMSTPIFLGSNTYANIAKFNFDANGVGHIKQFVSNAPQLAQDEFELIGSLWSPPHWMKGPEISPFDGQVVNAGKPVFTNTANSSGGSLIDTPQNLEQFGRYVTAWVKGWEQASGVPFEAISLQNELAFSVFYNSAVYDPVLYVKAVKAVDDAFAAHNAAFPNDPVLTKLHGPEDVGVGPQGDLGLNWRQFRYIDAVRDDPQANAAIDLWSLHGVDNFTIDFDDPASNRENWTFWAEGRSTSDPGTQWAQWEGVGDDARPAWQTEHSGEADAWLSGSRSSNNGALALGVRMHDALTAGQVEAYLFWQTQLDSSGDVRPDALTVGNDPDRPKVAAFRHFSKHIRPGAERVEVQTDDAQLLASAYRHDDNQTLTYVLINIDDQNDTVVLDLPSELGLDSVQAWRSSDGSYYQPLALGLPSSDTLSVFLPRESMLTLVFSWASGLLSGDYNGSGQVEQADLDLVLQNWGGFGTPTGWVNDLPQGQVDQAELDAVLQNWGGTAAPIFSDVAVPEPGAGVILGVAGLSAGARRRVHD